MLTGAWNETRAPLCSPRPFSRHSLRNNNIGADGARALAAALPQCTALQTL